jgi:hypothetical protein
MIGALDWWKAVVWFAASGAVLMVCAGWYASALISASRLSAAVKNLAASALYMTFGASIVAPLFAAVWYHNAFGGSCFDDVLSTVLILIAYGLSVAPALYVIFIQRIAALRAAGWFQPET